MLTPTTLASRALGTFGGALAGGFGLAEILAANWDQPIPQPIRIWVLISAATCAALSVIGLLIRTELRYHESKRFTPEQIDQLRTIIRESYGDESFAVAVYDGVEPHVDALGAYVDVKQATLHVLHGN